VLGCLDDDLVRPDAIHLVVEAFTLPVECSLDAQRRELVGHHAQRPARAVPRAAVAAVGKDFRRRLAFVAIAKWTEARAPDLNFIPDEVRRPGGSASSNDDPPSGDGVFS
jgi:hypothetical protein